MPDDASCPDPLSSPVLNVRQSASGRRWVWRAASLADLELRQGLAIAQRAGVPELLGRILVSRDVSSEKALAFLDPRLRDWMPDPACLRDMDRAAARLAQAIREQACVGLFGDYDVDGACGTALVASVLKELGCTVETHIPDRQKEGYGPNAAALDAMLDKGSTLLVCIDCGTAAVDVLNPFAIRTDLIVLDHHKPDGGILPDAIVVNPNRVDCTSQLGTLCATGVAFLTLVAVLRELRLSGWFKDRPAPDLMRHLDLVALATICDVMPLQGLNRALVAQGLRVLGRGERLGLATLASVAMVRDTASPTACGFAFGPRINAGGRIAQSGLGLRLLLAEDAFEARQLSEKLDEVNRQRQTVEADILSAAMAEAEIQADAGHAVLFLHGEAWHPGVVGIVAGRIRERFNRPTLVGAEADGIIKGSARSVPGIDLGAAIIAARQAGLLQTGGGHAMAAGFSLSVEAAQSFHIFLDERLDAARALPKHEDLLLDGVLTIRGANHDVVEQIARLAPFGAGNPEPVLVVTRVRCVKSERIGRDGNTLRVILQGEDGGRLKGLVFRADDKAFTPVLEDLDAPLLHVAGNLRSETWQDRHSLTLFVCDIATL